MLFSSFCLLPFISFILYSYRPTAAATLAVSPIKPRKFNSIECWGLLPPPPNHPPFPSVLAMCAGTALHPGNLECKCIGSVLVCGRSRRSDIQALIRWCFDHCECGPRTTISDYVFPMDLDLAWTTGASGNREGQGSKTPSSSGSCTGSTGSTGSTGGCTGSSAGSSTGSSTGSSPGSSCSGTCTSVDRGCNRASNGRCQCFAPPVSLSFWHIGDCGTRLPFKAKRDLAQQRHSHYLNATGEFASSNEATAPLGPVPNHAAQLASGLLPSPCNASYVSFACSDSSDGIVHEPPQNWLGALVPEGAKELPPVPKEFLRIHGGKEGKEGKMQVLRPAVDSGGLELV